MVPVPVIEVGEGEFRLNTFLRTYWYLFIFIAFFCAITIILALTFLPITGTTATFSIIGVTFDLQAISIGASLLVTYLGVSTILWTAFEKPVARPIFYYFIGIEAFKRLLLLIPLVSLVLALTIWIYTLYPGVLIVIFALVGFCAGLVVFASVLVLISRASSVRNIVMVTITYALVVFFVTLGLLLFIDIRSLPDYFSPFTLFLFAMGIASVFYILMTLIFEIIMPVFSKVH
ncbi:MAG TPA: hypothetical protein PK679_05510 [Methanolinea sp.]|nr:hypothetical protein [Methanolinea sp.]